MLGNENEFYLISSHLRKGNQLWYRDFPLFSAPLTFWKADSGTGNTVSVSIVTERIGIMSRAMTPPCSPAGGPEGECSRLKEAPLGVSLRSYSERRKLILKSAKNFPQKL